MMLNRLFLSVFLVFVGYNMSFSQVIFSESFDEAADATTGTDEEGGIAWEASCPDCIGDGDYFKVVGGALEGQDTNGPATWVTSEIDISSCDFIEIALDLAESGTMEGCETGCNSVDYVQLEYNIDGAGWESPADAAFCGGDCADVFVIQSDDIDGGSTVYSTGCIAGGESIELRITIQAWASSERWMIDNVTVSCTDGTPVDAGEDMVICEGTAVTLEADNPTGADLSWTDGVVDGVSFVPPVGTEEYVVTATGGVCDGTDAVTITVIEEPTADVDAAGPFSIASGLQTLVASPAGGVWSSDCGACIDATTGVFDPAIAGDGVWEVCYTVGVDPCIDTDCINILVSSGDCLLGGAIDSNNPTCFGFSDGSVTITTVGASGDPVIVITNADGDILNPDGSNTANTLSEGWYYFSITDDVPCTFVDSVFLNDPDQMEVVLSVEDVKCHGDATGAIRVDNLINYTGAYEDVSFFWAPSEDGYGGIGVDTLVNIPVGEYVLTINDGNGCSIVVDTIIEQPSPLDFAELYTDPAYCRLKGYQFGHGRAVVAAKGGTSDYTYEWLELATGETFVNTTWGGRNPGSYQVTIVDANDCILTDVVEIDSLNPVADFDMTSPQFTSDYEGTAVVDVHFVNNSINFANEFNPLADTIFYWSFGYGGSVLSKDLYEEFDTSYYNAGVYEVCLTVYNQNGCYDSLCKEIVVYDLFEFSAVNVFTPNGDGANDLFSFNYHAQSVKDFKCEIVNRWGVKVAEINSIDGSWDGNLNGDKPANEGVYFYIYSGTSFNGDNFNGQGNVQLIRQN